MDARPTDEMGKIRGGGGMEREKQVEPINRAII